MLAAKTLPRISRRCVHDIFKAKHIHNEDMDMDVMFKLLSRCAGVGWFKSSFTSRPGGLAEFERFLECEC